MQVETVPTDSVRPDPRNARRHERASIDTIKGSLRRFGQQRPLLVDLQDVVVAGNGTLQAARELGWRQVDVVRCDLSEAERAAYAIADNRIAEKSAWDVDALMESLSATDLGDLSDLGFDDADLAALTAGLALPQEAPAAQGGQRADLERGTRQDASCEAGQGSQERRGNVLKLTQGEAEALDEFVAWFRENRAGEGPRPGPVQCLLLALADYKSRF